MFEMTGARSLRVRIREEAVKLLSVRGREAAECQRSVELLSVRGQ